MDINDKLSLIHQELALAQAGIYLSIADQKLKSVPKKPAESFRSILTFVKTQVESSVSLESHSIVEITKLETLHADIKNLRLRYHSRTSRILRVAKEFFFGRINAVVQHVYRTYMKKFHYSLVTWTVDCCFPNFRNVRRDNLKELANLEIFLSGEIINLKNYLHSKQLEEQEKLRELERLEEKEKQEALEKQRQAEEEKLKQEKEIEIPTSPPQGRQLSPLHVKTKEEFLSKINELEKGDNEEFKKIILAFQSSYKWKVFSSHPECRKKLIRISQNYWKAEVDNKTKVLKTIYLEITTLMNQDPVSSPSLLASYLKQLEEENNGCPSKIVGILQSIEFLGTEPEYLRIRKSIVDKISKLKFSPLNLIPEKFDVSKEVLEVIQELISTEENFLTKITLFSTLNENSGLTKKEVKNVLKGYKELQIASKDFFSLLSDKKEQEALRILKAFSLSVIQNYCRAFLTVVKNYVPAKNIIDEKKLGKTILGGSSGIEIDNLLIEPIQRVARLNILLESLINKLEKSNPTPSSLINLLREEHGVLMILIYELNSYIPKLTN